jgi:hypothetical protein
MGDISEGVAKKIYNEHSYCYRKHGTKTLRKKVGLKPRINLSSAELRFFLHLHTFSKKDCLKLTVLLFRLEFLASEAPVRLSSPNFSHFLKLSTEVSPGLNSTSNVHQSSCTQCMLFVLLLCSAVIRFVSISAKFIICPLWV